MHHVLAEKLGFLFKWLKRKTGFLTENKKTASIFVILVLVGVFFLVQPASAITGKDVYLAFVNFCTNTFLWLGEWCIRMSLFFLRLFIGVAKYNGYLDAPTVRVGWAMVRDVANMFFVVVLLAISFGTILGIEQYQWNKTLIKLILAAVFINFSNLICGIFIDIAHVFTITFVNAIQTTADGNLINMFKLNKVHQFVSTKPPEATENFEVRLMGTATVAFLFAFLAMMIILAYSVVMVARLVVLWVLIVLSPLAFIFSVLEKTKSYADAWWKEFGKHVMVAPMMVFFLWLAFATVGSGNVVDDMKGGGFDLNQAEYQSQSGETLDSSTLGAITEWNTMANFLIPLVLLLVGLEKVQELGVQGSGLLSSAKSFFGDVAKIATGYATGRAVYDFFSSGERYAEGIGKKVAVAPFKFLGGIGKSALADAPLIGGRSWKRGWRKLEMARKYSPVLRHIPFIGKFNEMYQNKLDDRADTTEKLRQDAFMKDFSKMKDPMIAKMINWAPNLLAKGVGKTVGAIPWFGNQKLSDVLGMEEWAKGGILGIDAWTARRDASETDYKAAVEMRSATNKESRKARNESELRISGLKLIEGVQNKHFDNWASQSGFYDSDKLASLIGRDVDEEDRYQNWLQSTQSSAFESWLNKNKKWNGLTTTTEQDRQRGNFWNEWQGENGERLRKEYGGNKDNITRFKANVDAGFESWLSVNEDWLKLGDKEKKKGRKKFRKNYEREKLQDSVDEDGRTFLHAFNNSYSGQEAREELGKINKSGVGVSRKERMARNVAQVIIQDERLTTLHDENKVYKQRSQEAALNSFVADKEKWMTRRARAEALGKLGDDAFRKVKNEKLEQEYAKALDAIRGANGNMNVLTDLARHNSVARAFMNAAKAGKKEDMMDIIKDDLSSEAKGQYVDMVNRWSTTPPSARIDKAERDKKEFDQLGEQGRGIVMAKVLAQLLEASSKGKSVARETQEDSLAVLMSATLNGNFDDGLSGLASEANLYEKYLKARDKGQDALDQAFSKQEQEYMEQYQERFKVSRDTAQQKGWIRIDFNSDWAEKREGLILKGMSEADADASLEAGGVAKYKWVDKNSEENSGEVQSFMLSGGDMNFTEVQSDILKYKEEHNIASFRNAAQEYFRNNGERLRTSGNKYASYESFFDKLGKLQDVFKNVAENFKENGVSIGHYQLVNLIMDDELNMVRRGTHNESLGVVSATTNKRDFVSENPQSGGIYVNATAKNEELEEGRAAQLHILRANTLPAMEKFKARTRRIFMDSNRDKEMEVENGYAQLSENSSRISAAGAGNYLFGLFDRLVRTHSFMAKRGRSAALMTAVEAKNMDRYRAEAGEMKAEIAGFEEWIRSGRFEREMRSAGMGDTEIRDIKDNGAKYFKFNNAQEYAGGIAKFVERYGEQIFNAMKQQRDVETDERVKAYRKDQLASIGRRFNYDETSGHLEINKLADELKGAAESARKRLEEYKRQPPKVDDDKRKTDSD